MAERKTILVVDDTPDILMTVNNLLKGTYKVKVARNGAKALKIATSSTPPDLILLDIMMPEMSGFEVCQKLNEDPKACQIPVIFLSGKDSKEDKVYGLSLGAVDFLPKPIVPSELQSVLQEHF